MSSVLRPNVDDLRVIGFYLGKVLGGLGLLMAIPLVIALVLREWNAAAALGLGAGVSLTALALSEAHLQTRRTLSWAHGMVIVALAWIVGSAFAAIPMHVSGRFSDALSAYFEAVSALTTTGMSVIHDLDHLEISMGLYRHLLQIAGGLGIIIVILALFSAGGSRVGVLYASEARDERILPNVLRTSRFIVRVAMTFFAASMILLVPLLLAAGFSLPRALEHGLALFLSSFATGGFSLMQSSVAYYHSAPIELVVMLIMFAGLLSFALHHALWSRDLREFTQHLETRTLTLTTVALAMLMSLGFVRDGTYGELTAIVRRGLFTLVSAVSSTGHQVNAGETYVTDWGILAPAGVVGAMAIGGMASSTAGGIKALRLGLAFKGVVHDIRRFLLPDAAVVVTCYHVGRRRTLRPETVRAATTVLLLFVLSFLLGTLTALMTGEVDLTEALFEGVSIGANIGISVGVVEPDMPRALMAVYIVQMILGRLEFVAVLVLVGYLLSFRRGSRALGIPSSGRKVSR